MNTDRSRRVLKAHSIRSLLLSFCWATERTVQPCPKNIILLYTRRERTDGLCSVCGAMARCLLGGVPGAHPLDNAVPGVSV